MSLAYEEHIIDELSSFASEGVLTPRTIINQARDSIRLRDLHITHMLNECGRYQADEQSPFSKEMDFAFQKKFNVCVMNDALLSPVVSRDRYNDQCLLPRHMYGLTKRFDFFYKEANPTRKLVWSNTLGKKKNRELEKNSSVGI